MIVLNTLSTVEPPSENITCPWLKFLNVLQHDLLTMTKTIFLRHENFNLWSCHSSNGGRCVRAPRSCGLPFFGLWISIYHTPPVRTILSSLSSTRLAFWEAMWAPLRKIMKKLRSLPIVMNFITRLGIFIVKPQPTKHIQSCRVGCLPSTQGLQKRFYDKSCY